jgi:hypothetical protein
MLRYWNAQAYPAFKILGVFFHKNNARDIVRYVEKGLIPIGWVRTIYDKPITLEELKGIK